MFVSTILMCLFCILQEKKIPQLLHICLLKGAWDVPIILDFFQSYCDFDTIRTVIFF